LGELARMIRGYPLPVFALGDARMSDLETAWSCGAHGYRHAARGLVMSG
jgi:hypothetical protein